MINHQADTAPGDLQTDRNKWTGLEGEFRRRIITQNKTEAFKLFNLIVSKSIVEKRLVCSFEFYSYVFFNCLEKIRQVEKESAKMKAFVFISKYPIDFILTNFKELRKDLLVFHQKIHPVLYSPRALGSASNKEALKDLELFERNLPGKSKSSFPAQAFIGVGYQDKGSSRLKSYDGSPDWRDVAMLEATESTQKSKVPIKGKQLRILQSDSLVEMRERSLRRSLKRRRQEYSLLD